MPHFRPSLYRAENLRLALFSFAKINHLFSTSHIIPCLPFSLSKSLSHSQLQCHRMVGFCRFCTICIPSPLISCRSLFFSRTASVTFLVRSTFFDQYPTNPVPLLWCKCVHTTAPPLPPVSDLLLCLHHAECHCG